MKELCLKEPLVFSQGSPGVGVESCFQCGKKLALAIALDPRAYTDGYFLSLLKRLIRM